MRALAICQWPHLANKWMFLIQATVPPTEISPGPSYWQPRWQWLGHGSAGGICQGWPANKSHHLEWAGEENRIREKHLDTVNMVSFLVKSLDLTVHYFFSYSVATTWDRKKKIIQSCGLVPWQDKFTIPKFRFSKLTSNLSLSELFSSILKSPIDPSLLPLSTWPCLLFQREKTEGLFLAKAVTSVQWLN